MTDAADAVPVLIVGAGPVGLALAGDLGWRGRRCLIVEQGDGSIYQPRMDFVGFRTMEFCRRWGLVDAVEHSPYPRDYPQDNMYLTALNGYELGRERFPAMQDEVAPPQSPQHRERCPQNMFDPILLQWCRSMPQHVEMRYRTKLLGFTQDADGVSAELEAVESGQRETIRARYLVGCDGGASRVRDVLGIGMSGRGVLTYTTNVIFRCADLVKMHDKGKAYRHIFVGPEGTFATIVAINGRDQWRLSIIGTADKKTHSEADIRAVIRRVAGFDFDYEILSVLPWVRRALVADKFGEGRVFIAGDAAHLTSPTGGFGMNMGIQDAVDLSWKLDACLSGWGGPHLLESYTPERRPVSIRNVNEASGNLGRMRSPGENKALLDDTPEGAALRTQLGKEFTAAMTREWHTLGIHLGYRYDDSPIIWPDGTPAPPMEVMTYDQTARPGARAPHVWLKDGRSTLDLFGKAFVLLRIGKDAPAGEALAKAASQRGVPLVEVALDEPEVARAYERRLVLVRPDGHVAWRDDRMPADPLRLIDCVRGAGMKGGEEA
ncbi:MAG TPA: FAD-dependent oxidoreductase [Stellaceae bacterium]|jgi:2-polyprenyl-6-methoxyphenol hydroxylase-like FAD-dependent oxidoreductase|nr:FAD-dependent oxidoreductase [Stellaceae bacterium]